MERESLLLPPFSIDVDGFKVDILEVLKSELISGETWYHVVVTIDYKGIKSKSYTIDVRDMNDLIKKLKVEITKIKMIEYSQGLDEVRRRIT